MDVRYFLQNVCVIVITLIMPQKPNYTILLDLVTYILYAHLRTYCDHDVTITNKAFQDIMSLGQTI